MNDNDIVKRISINGSTPIEFTRKEWKYMKWLEIIFLIGGFIAGILLAIYCN